MKKTVLMGISVNGENSDNGKKKLMEKNSVYRKRTVLMEKIVLWKIVLMENSAYGKSCC